MQVNWSEEMMDFIPKLTAYIFAIWTLDNSAHYFDMKNDKNTLLMPHAAQVISIFRMMGIGYDEKSEYKALLTSLLPNNLVQIPTGEGKSIVLAVCSIILALFGAEVYCR